MLARTPSLRLALPLLLALWPAPAWAARHALLIANADYSGARADLGNPPGDARHLAKALEGVGFASAKVVDNLNERKLRRAVNAFTSELEPGDEALVYYAGHGVAFDGTNYLLGVDFEAETVTDAKYDDVYPVSQLVEALERSKAAVRIVVVDACRDNPLTRSWSRSRASRGFVPIPRGRGGTLVAFAAAPGQQALDRLPRLTHGPYVSVLVEELSGGKEVMSRFRDVGRRVGELTGQRQTPEFVPNILNDYYFTRVDAPVRREAPSVARLTPPPPEVEEEIPEGMVKVPGGAFFMGCNEKVDSECFDDEKPGRTVNLPTFFIDRTEVTVNAYAACVRAGRCSDHHLEQQSTGRDFEESKYCNWKQSGRGEHPINCVNWEQATEYCAWKGHRLPTEPEWEKAARGTDGRKYSWGNAGYRHTKYANIADETAKRTFGWIDIAAGYEDGFVGTAPVGSFPRGKSPYDALDMIGNVWEWTSAWYSSERKYRVPRRGGLVHSAR